MARNAAPCRPPTCCSHCHVLCGACACACAAGGVMCACRCGSCRSSRIICRRPSHGSGVWSGAERARAVRMRAYMRACMRRRACVRATPTLTHAGHHPVVHCCPTRTRHTTPVPQAQLRPVPRTALWLLLHRDDTQPVAAPLSPSRPARAPAPTWAHLETAFGHFCQPASSWMGHLPHPLMAAHLPTPILALAPRPAACSAVVAPHAGRARCVRAIVCGTRAVHMRYMHVQAPGVRHGPPVAAAAAG